MPSAPIAFSPRQIAQLASHQYHQDYTPILNRALPVRLRASLEVFHQQLFDTAMGDDETSYTVRSESGAYAGVFGPATVALAAPEGPLTLYWGERSTTLFMDSRVACHTLLFRGADSLSAVFPYDDALGTKLLIQYEESSDNRTVDRLTLPVGIRLSDEVRAAKAPLELLHAAMETDDLKRIQKCFAVQESGDRLEGPFLKISYLPIGTHTVSRVVRRETDYGRKYWLQVSPDPDCLPFRAETRKKQASGDWDLVPCQVHGPCIVISNRQLERVLDVEPVINPEAPATLIVLSHGMYNGYPTAEVVLKPSALGLSEEDAFGTIG